MADTKTKNDEWLAGRLEHIKGLKSPSDQQRLLLALCQLPAEERDAKDERRITALVRAEKAAERAAKERAKAARIVDEAKQAERKARDHELYKSAGLLIMAGLVDTKTGQPIGDRAELLGALMGLAKVPEDDPRREDWQRAGAAKLAERKK